MREREIPKEIRNVYKCICERGRSPTLFTCIGRSLYVPDHFRPVFN